MKVIANKSILHNNTTGCTFIASQMDQDVQTGTRENDSHIEWMGDLTIPANQHTAPLIEALEEAKLQIEYLHRKFSKTGSGESVLSRIETALLNAKG